MKVGVLDSGDVGRVLGSGFLKHGHEVMVGTRTPGKLAEWTTQNSKGKVGSFADAAAFAELIVLAVKGKAAEGVLRSAGAENFMGKFVMDTTNPIEDAPPVNGVLKFFTNLDESLMERLQREFEGANFVKVFNSVGSASMVNPQFRGGRPTMFICATMKRQSSLRAEFSISLVGKRPTWARRRLRGPLNPCACFGVSPDFYATSGLMRLNCRPEMGNRPNINSASSAERRGGA